MEPDRYVFVRTVDVKAMSDIEKPALGCLIVANLARRAFQSLLTKIHCDVRRMFVVGRSVHDLGYHLSLVCDAIRRFWCPR